MSPPDQAAPDAGEPWWPEVGWAAWARWGQNGPTDGGGPSPQDESPDLALRVTSVTF